MESHKYHGINRDSIYYDWTGSGIKARLCPTQIVRELWRT